MLNYKIYNALLDGEIGLNEMGLVEIGLRFRTLLKKVAKTQLKRGMMDDDCLVLLSSFSTAGRQADPDDVELSDAALKDYHVHSGMSCGSVCKTVSGFFYVALACE